MKWISGVFTKVNLLVTLQEVIKDIQKSLVTHEKHITKMGCNEKLIVEKIRNLQSENKDLKARLFEVESRLSSLKIVMDTDRLEIQSDLEKYISNRKGERRLSSPDRKTD